MTVNNDPGEMEQCASFETCSAPLCPRDSDLKLRAWFMDEDICRSLQYRQSSMVRRQVQLKRRMPVAFSGKALTAEYLVQTAHVKRTLSPERKARLLEASKPFRFAKKDAVLPRKQEFAMPDGEMDRVNPLGFKHGPNLRA